MRVTQNTNFATIQEAIHRSRSRMGKYKMQTASTRKLNSPSDDPVGATKVLQMRTGKLKNEQFQMNANMAQSFLSNSEHVLSELSEIVVRAKELALAQASGISGNDSSRLGVAEEINQLYQQAVSSANRRVGDRYLLAGYRVDQPAVDEKGRYQGDSGQMMVEIADEVFIAMNVPGIDVFNTDSKNSNDSNRQREEGRNLASPSGADFERHLGENVNLFDELQTLRISLLSGDLEGIRSTLDRLDDMHAKLVATRAKIGSRLNGLQNTLSALERQNLVNAELSSTLEDADMVEVMTGLAREETILRSALQSSQKLVQPTLMDFLR
jgi:flagellar hook-associated protein 3 FlgL